MGGDIPFLGKHSIFLNNASAYYGWWLLPGEEKKAPDKPNKGKKSKIFIYYGAGIYIEIIGIGGLLYFVLVAGASFALFLFAFPIIIGVILLAYAEHLRRKLKKRRFN